MMAQISPAATAKETRSTAVRPPKRTLTSESSRSGAMSLPEIAVGEDRMHPGEQARKAARQKQDHDDDQDREQQLLEPGKVAEEFRRSGEQRRAQHRAHQAAEPAHHDD